MLMTSFDHNHLPTCPVSHTIMYLAGEAGGLEGGQASMFAFGESHSSVPNSVHSEIELLLVWSSGVNFTTCFLALILCHLCSTSMRSAPNLLYSEKHEIDGKIQDQAWMTSVHCTVNIKGSNEDQTRS